MRKPNAFARTLITDICVAIPMIIALALVNQLGQPYLRGFFCDDTTIVYPYKENTVTSATLFAVGITLPVVSFIVVEFGLQKWLTHDKFDSRGWPKKAPSSAIGFYHITVAFLFGAGATTLITELGKIAIGRLRPHFISVCQPVGSAYSMCQPTGLATLRYVPSDAYTCNGTGFTTRQLKDARLSFPSGHASFSVYTMVFLILYLQGRVVWREMRLLRGGLQTIAATLAYMCCLSRVTDNKHHPTDVLAGSILGAAAACYVIFATLRLMPIVSIRDVRLGLTALGVGGALDRDPISGRVCAPNEPEAEMGVAISISEHPNDRLPQTSRSSRNDTNESAKVTQSASAFSRPPRAASNMASNPIFSTVEPDQAI